MKNPPTKGEKAVLRSMSRMITDGRGTVRTTDIFIDHGLRADEGRKFLRFLEQGGYIVRADKAIPYRSLKPYRGR